MISELTTDRLKSVLRYDPDAGVWIWLVRTRRSQTKIGDFAGHFDTRSKILGIRIDGLMYSAGRLCFFYMTGSWPDGTAINDGPDKKIYKWSDLRIAKKSPLKGTKRPPAKSEDERLDRRRAQFKKWYDKNGPRPWTPERGEMRAAAAARWRKRHPEKNIVLKNSRRARELGASGSHTEFDLLEILKAQKNKCGYCRIRLTTKNKNIDHVIALARGGTNNRQNLQYLCSPCNRKKNAKDPIDFARKIGMLL